MADGTIDIYIDSSFFSVASDTEDIYTHFTAAEADNIGQRDMPVDYFVAAAISGTLDTLAEVFITNSGVVQAGYVSTSTRYQAATSISGLEVALVDYAIPITSSGLTSIEDVDLEYFTGIAAISGALDSNINFIGGQSYDFSTNILSTYWTFEGEILNDDYEVDYTAGSSTSGTNNTTSYFTAGAATNSGAIGVDHEVFFPGFPIDFDPDSYTYRFHLVAGLEGTNQAANWEATVISGAILDIPFDVYSTATTSGYYKYEAICGLVDLVSYSFDSEVVSGTISYFNGESICGVSGTQGYGFDVDLFSLKISNFSLDIDEYTDASGTICVDITDDVHNVVTSGTYFIIDETVVSGTFTAITDGYTMCYDSPTDFDDLLGSTTVTVHAENDNDDVLEQNFYVTSGYIVEYDNRTQDYGYGSQVVVRGSAENLASCPNTGVDAYFFTTDLRQRSDLGATIVGQPFDRIVVTPSGAVVNAVIGTQQYTAEIYDLENNTVSGIPFTWSTSDGGTIDNNGLFTAGSKLGVFNNAVVASHGDLEGYTSVEVKDMETVYFYGKTFGIEVRARDFAGNVMEPFTFEFRIEDEPE